MSDNVIKKHIQNEFEKLIIFKLLIIVFINIIFQQKKENNRNQFTLRDT